MIVASKKAAKAMKIDIAENLPCVRSSKPPTSYGAVCTSPKIDERKKNPKKKIAPIIAWNMRSPFLSTREPT